MSKLEKKVHSSSENLFSVDSEGSSYDDYSRLTSLLSPKIIDKTTFYAMDVPDLFEAVNYTKTKTGATTLFKSLIQPLVSLEVILEKQNSLRELENNKEARKALKQYLKKLSEREPYVHKYLFQCAYCQKEPYNLRFVDQYKLYTEFKEFFRIMVDGLLTLATMCSMPFPLQNCVKADTPPLAG